MHYTYKVENFGHTHWCVKIYENNKAMRDNFFSHNIPFSNAHDAIKAARAFIDGIKYGKGD